MGEEPKDWGAIVSNIIQVAILVGAIVLGGFALLKFSSWFRYPVLKLLIVGVPVAMAAAAAIGSKK
jgi:uncharacterized membrane protein